jgi:predicted SAM-dependent methyltransferase
MGLMSQKHTEADLPANQYFKTRYSPNPKRKLVWRAICEYLQQFINTDNSILELGAGYCDFINQIRGTQKYAVDKNPDVAFYCAPDVRFIQAKVPASLSLPPQSIDVIFGSNLLEHLSDLECSSLFEQFSYFLNEKGKLIFIQPNYYYSYRTYWDDFTHVKAFSHVSLNDFIVARGYKIVRLEKRFLPFSMKSYLPKSYWLTKMYLASFWRPMAKQMLVVAQK